VQPEVSTLLERLRTNAYVVPPDRHRLWVGLGVAVLGPVAATLLLRVPAIAARPSLGYFLVIVVATAYGRALAGLISIPWSVFLIETMGHDWLAARGIAEQDLWTTGAFLLVAATVVLIVTRSDAAADVATTERSRFELLAKAGDSLSESLDIRETLGKLGDVLVPVLADWFSVDLYEDGAIRNAIVMHPDPAKVELSKELQRRFPAAPDSPTGAPNVIRTGVSELTETIPDAMLEALIDDPELLATMRGLGLRCAMVVPLRARGYTIGAITLIGAESHERYTSEDLVLAEEIADRAALAIDTARLFEAETTQRNAALREAERNAILQNVTATYGRAATVAEVIEATVQEALPAAGAERATLGLVEDGHRVVLRRVAGYERNDRPYWYAFELSDPYPMSEAIVHDRPVVLSSAAEVKARYPDLQGEGDPRDHVLVCVPLSLGGSVIGAFSASSPPGSTFDDDDLALLRSIGEQCAQAIDRARSRERAERAQHRLVAVSAASQGLAGSLAFDETVRTIMRLAKEHLGDSVALVAFDDRGPTLLDEVGSPLPAGVHVADVEELDPVRLLAEGPLALAGAADEPPAAVLPLVIAGSVRSRGAWRARSRTRACTAIATTSHARCSKGCCPRGCPTCLSLTARRCSARPNAGRRSVATSMTCSRWEPAAGWRSSATSAAREPRPRRSPGWCDTRSARSGTSTGRATRSRSSIARCCVRSWTAGSARSPSCCSNPTTATGRAPPCRWPGIRCRRCSRPTVGCSASGGTAPCSG
jgi:GAF domain-containing protein